MTPQEVAKRRAEIYAELVKHKDPTIRESIKVELLQKAGRRLSAQNDATNEALR